MSDTARPPAGAATICRVCGNDVGDDPVQLLDAGQDPDAVHGWTCLECFTAMLCPDDLGGMPWEPPSR